MGSTPTKSLIELVFRMFQRPSGSEGTFSPEPNYISEAKSRPEDSIKSWQDILLAVVVEDEWSIRMQIVDLLLDAGWQVEEFASAEQAIDFLDKRSEIRVLITDIRLTGTLTGWDVADAYRRSSPDMKILYCSGNPPEPTRQVVGSEFMPKPCEMDALLKAVTA
jgi:CheY-like chemotaxis protein